jgi:hypothetical protein
MLCSTVVALLTRNTDGGFESNHCEGENVKGMFWGKYTNGAMTIVPLWQYTLFYYCEIIYV